MGHRLEDRQPEPLRPAGREQRRGPRQDDGEVRVVKAPKRVDPAAVETRPLSFGPQVQPAPAG